MADSGGERPSAAPTGVAGGHEARSAADGHPHLAEQRFARVMEASLTGMALLDLDGRFLAVNSALSRMLGRDADTLTRMTSIEVTHPDDIASDLAYSQRAQADEASVQPLEKRFVRPDGQVVWGLLTLSFVRDPAGAPVQMIGQVLDITDRKQIEDSEQYRRFLERMAGRIAHVGGWAIDRVDERLFWSDETYRLVDCPPEFQPSRDDALALYLPGDQLRLAEAVDTCLTDGTPFDLELHLHTFAGRLITARVVGEPEHAPDGRVLRVIGAFQDITDVRAAELEASRLAERLAATMESISDGVYTLREDWTFSYLNRRAEELLGTTRAEMLDRDFFEAFPSTVGSPIEMAYRRAMHERATGHVEAYYCAPLGLWFEEQAFPSEDGITVYIRDIGVRIEHERHQQRILAAERDAADQLRQLDRMKNAFLSAVSHELRTPLAIVNGAAATLQRMRGRLADKTRAELEDALVNQSDRLNRLLADLLDIDRLTRAGSEAARDTFDLSRLVRDVTASSPAHERIVLDVPGQLDVTADRVEIERIVANLVGNAVKYAPDGDIVVRARTRYQGGFLLEVHDEGPGIPEHELTRIFEPFHRVDSDDPKPGTGVGLALVAEFARMHGGRAWADAAPGGGAHLYVEIPPPGTGTEVLSAHAATMLGVAGGAGADEPRNIPPEQETTMESCHECGFVYGALDREAIGDALRRSVAAIAPELERAQAAGVERTRPQPGRWSPIEYACHVRDVLLAQHDRLELALIEPHPTLPPMGRERLVIERRYAEQAVSDVVDELAAAAEALASRLEELEDAEWQRTGVYAWAEPVTADMVFLGRHTVHECVHHLGDIRTDVTDFTRAIDEA